MKESTGHPVGGGGTLSVVAVKTKQDVASEVPQVAAGGARARRPAAGGGHAAPGGGAGRRRVGGAAALGLGGVPAEGA